MEKLEYKCVTIIGCAGRITRILNEYAEEGWELVATYWIWFYFKRPKKV